MFRYKKFINTLMQAIEIREKADSAMARLFPKDKAIHLIIGLHVFVACILLGATNTTALIITGGIGVLIEIVQKVFKIGAASWLDAFYVLYGGLLPFTALLINGVI